jgi:ribosomal protein S18 acetylase RimI-like enzyme
MSATHIPRPTAARGSAVTYRPYGGLDEIDGMAAANGALRTRTGWTEPVDPAALRHRYQHLVNCDPPRDVLIAEVDGSTAGYVRTEWHDLADGDRDYEVGLVVDPVRWGRGIAAHLLGWAEARLIEVAAGHPTSRPSWFTAETLDGDVELETALAARGYAAVRREAEMLRPDLEDLPDVAVPAGYTLRTPTEADLPAVHAMDVLAFAEHWGAYEAEEQDVSTWAGHPRFRREHVVVAWSGDDPVCCVNNQLRPARDGSVHGLLNGVATHPDHRRRGLARAAVAASLHLLREVGASAAVLGVDTGNANQAISLYESFGFRLVSSATIHRRPFGAQETRR